MQNDEITKSEVDTALYKFLQSIYLFERRESTLFGITWGETYLLHLLKRAPGMPVSEVARQLKVQDFFASRMITKLSKEGLTRREGSQGDRRVVKVFLTDTGKQKLNEIENYNYSIISTRSENVPIPDVKVLMKSIEQLGTFFGLV